MSIFIHSNLCIKHYLSKPVLGFFLIMWKKISKRSKRINLDLWVVLIGWNGDVAGVISIPRKFVKRVKE